MALHPNGSQLLTGSADTTIRSWNLELGREVEKLETLHPVEGLVVYPKHEFYSFSATCINTWTINHLHDFLIQLGSSVMKLTSTSHPRVSDSEAFSYLCR
jgi:WD40 repeat protein